MSMASPRGAPWVARRWNGRLTAVPCCCAKPAGSCGSTPPVARYKSESAGGAWTVVPSPPAALLGAASKIQANKAEPKPDPMLPASGKPPAQAPAVLLATQPAELVVTSGEPKMTPVGGTSLLTVSNADHAVFVDPSTNQYYVRALGPLVPRADADRAVDARRRQPAAGGLRQDLPAGPQGQRAGLWCRARRRAREAEIAATIPQTASVARAKATVAVVYDGTPKFAPITRHLAAIRGEHGHAGHRGGHAITTTPWPTACWFTASVPGGPWHVRATEVPSAIYTIPPSSPIYYVTYVRICSVTPETVVVGYTPGYMGVVVNPDGTVVYGTGYVYPPYVGAYYYEATPPPTATAQDLPWA